MPGEIFGILGPNGAGKTTTLEMIEGLRNPDGGSIRVAGFDPVTQTAEVKRRIGIQLQTTALFDHLSVRELVELFAALYDANGSRERIDYLIGLVSLEEKANSQVHELSGGQQQRLSISLALVNDPEVVFLDEPTTGLDPQARRNLWDVIRMIRGEGKTVVLTTHYMEEAEILCDRVAIMDTGRILSCDTPRRLIDALQLGTTVQAQVNGAHLPAEYFQRLPGVTGVEIQDGQIDLKTDDTQSTVTELLTLARERDLRLEHMTVLSATLEDVFLNLTGKRLRS